MPAPHRSPAAPANATSWSPTGFACNRYLADAVHRWAFASLRRCRWAKQFYDAQRIRNKSHNAALRALGNRWLEVLWHCLTKQVRYSDAVHAANIAGALNTAPAAAA